MKYKVRFMDYGITRVVHNIIGYIGMMASNRDLGRIERMHVGQSITLYLDELTRITRIE